MRAGARHLIGHHDFSTFRDSLCQAKSPVKTLDALEVGRAGDEIHIAARARSFLHHQVRNMAGTLKLVGLGRWHPDDVARALAARDRRAGGPTAPPEGHIWSKSDTAVSKRAASVAVFLHRLRRYRARSAAISSGV